MLLLLCIAAVVVDLTPDGFYEHPSSLVVMTLQVLDFGCCCRRSGFVTLVHHGRIIDIGWYEMDSAR